MAFFVIASIQPRLTQVTSSVDPIGNRAMFVGRGVGSVPTDDTTANTAGCLANAQPTTAGSIVRVTVTNPVWPGID